MSGSRFVLVALFAVAAARKPELPSLSEVGKSVSLSHKLGDVTLGAALPSNAITAKWVGSAKDTPLIVEAKTTYAKASSVDVKVTANTDLGKLTIEADSTEAVPKALSIERSVVALGRKLTLTPVLRARAKTASLKASCEVVDGAVLEGTLSDKGALSGTKLTVKVSDDDKVSLTPDYIELKHALPTAELSVGLSRENPSLGVQYENKDEYGGWTVSFTSPLQAPGASSAKIHRKLEL